MVWGKCGTYFKVVSGVQIFGVCMYVCTHTYMGGGDEMKKRLERCYVVVSASISAPSRGFSLST